MNSYTELVGLGAAACTTLAFVPQLVHIYKTKNTDGISLKMYIVFVLGVVLWLSYGILLQAAPLVIANAITLVLSGAILGMKIRDVLYKKHTSPN